MSLLLTVIFITFIGVGLPDSLFGTAWPAVYRELNLPISLAGYITSTVCACTILSSLISATVIRKFGTGVVSAVSTLLTAVALLGYAAAPHPVFLFVFAIPLGLGAGSIDTALNHFVALHYSAAKMNFLHCFYGLGVAVSPYIMSLALGKSDNWRRGYLIVAILQFTIALVAVISLPLWKRAGESPQSRTAVSAPAVSRRRLLCNRGVRLHCLAFLTSCALETCVGSWCSSYFVNSRGVFTDKAAQITLLFYAGLACGRFTSGLLARRISSTNLIRGAVGVLAIAVIAFVFPLPLAACAVVLFFIGLGIGPVFPNLTHLTPQNFGTELSQSVIGMEQAFAYVGILVVPWLFGNLAERFSTDLFPPALLVLFVLFFVTIVCAHRAIQRAAATAH